MLRFTKCHGSGNDFALVDARGMTGVDWGRVAQLLSDRAGPVGSDGLLLLTDGRGGADFGFAMWNPDGSEASTCLNGLRCVARAGCEAQGITRATVSLATTRAEVAMVEPIAPGVATVRTVAGPASTEPGDVGLRLDAPVIDAVVPGLPSRRAFTGVAMPNPHLVSFVERIDDDELALLGAWCEAEPELLVDRANVSFVQVQSDGLFVRTCERGAGLTQACGSAMAAATYAAGLSGRVPFGTAIVVRNPGGLVRARAEASGMVTIAGNATFEWVGEIDVQTLKLKVLAERTHEVAAWEALLHDAAHSQGDHR